MTNNTEIRSTTYSEVFGTLRLFYDCGEGELLYCAKDMAKMFGYKDPGRSVRNLCRHISKISFDTDGGVQRLNFINIDDVCRLCKHASTEDLDDLCEYIDLVTVDFFRDLETGFVDCEEDVYDGLFDEDEEFDDVAEYPDDEHDEGYLKLLEKNSAPELPHMDKATHDYLGGDFIDKFSKAIEAYQYSQEAIGKALRDPEILIKAALLISEYQADCINGKA